MKVDRLDATVYRFPTPAPEADGTLEWDATIAVVVTAEHDGVVGTGWTYSAGAAAALVTDKLSDAVLGRDANDVDGCFEAMRRACRNLGTKGLVMQAISAVDVALWDLKARLMEQPLTTLLGRTRDTVPIYGSGGFTTMTDEELDSQIEQWHGYGCRAMKIKIAESWGTCEDRDIARVRQLADAAGGAEIMVDANGGYSTAQARRIGAALDELGVVWFEEPVSSDDLQGLASVRSAVRCAVAAGEYASDVYDAEHLCGVVDCLQLDATRCGGYTGFRRGAAVAAAHNMPVSAHCAPALHAPVAAATPNLKHVEYFADHVRLEPLLLDGVPEARAGAITPNDTLGHGYRIAESAARYRIG